MIILENILKGFWSTFTMQLAINWPHAGWVNIFKTSNRIKSLNLKVEVFFFSFGIRMLCECYLGEIVSWKKAFQR